MPDRFHRELMETLAQTRAVFEDLRTLGLDEMIPAPIAEEGLPICTLEMQRADSGSHPACRPETLEEIQSELENCQRCALCSGRNSIVFGGGNPRAHLVFVGEGPGREEDRQGIPFVGEAGRLLDRILFAMGMSRDDVYICNVIKCRPPQNRDPKPDEIEACEPFLKRQLAAIRPRVIVALGKFAAQTLLRVDTPIGRLRGGWNTYEGIPLMSTYHPAYLLRNPAGKCEVWDDIKQVMARLRQEESKGA